MAVTYMLHSQSGYTINYCNKLVQKQILALPDSLAARYVFLSRRLLHIGPNLGEPHSKALGNRLFELRLKASEGIARVIYCIRPERNIVMLHCFIKKSQKIPTKELAIAINRMKDLTNE